MNFATPITLPCGVVLKNRFTKSAMSENMATKDHYPGLEFYNSYKRWSKGGVGLCISGNVMVDSRHRGEPNNVVIEKGLNNHNELKAWAKASENTQTQIWLQLNHPGKQTPKFLTKQPVAPSAVPLKSPLDRMFNCPKELTENEIQNIIERFAYAAKVAKETGFAGVQIHGAHGYLVSQFLSPLHNQRADSWGGCIENRIKFVQQIYLKIREVVGNKFPIGIKLNSADFSKGGFTHEEAIYVTTKLSELGIDLIEISGGSYEKTTMMGTPIKDSTKKREAYFIEYAKDIKKNIKCPLVVTGGFRTSKFMKESLENNELDLIGLGRSICINPDLPNQIMSGKNVISEVKQLTSNSKFLDSIFPLEIIWYTRQIKRMGAKKHPTQKLGIYSTILLSAFENGMQIFKKVRA